MSSPWSMGELMAGAYGAAQQARLEQTAEQPGNHGFADDLRYPTPEWVTGERGAQLVSDAHAAGSLTLGRTAELPLDIRAIGEKYGLLG
jgi:hypothetical protein